MADAPEPANAGRSAGESIALRQTIAASRSYGMGAAARPAPPAPGRAAALADAGHRRQRVDAVLLGGVPAPDAGLRTHRPGRDVRVLDLADPADARPGPPLGQTRRSTLAEERVVDRYGGTHLARSLRDLLASRHGSTLRGGVLIIASDGWDSDPPEELRAVMARLARRARRVVWLNPRAGVPGSSRWSGRWRRRCPSATRSCRPTRWRRCPTCSRQSRPARTAQLHKVTCTAGRNLPTPAASPRTIAWVARGVATKRISSALADGCWLAGQGPGRPRAAARSAVGRRSARAGRGAGRRGR